MEALSGLAVPYKSLAVGNHSFELVLGDGFFEAFENSPVKSGRAGITVAVRRGASGMTLGVRIDSEVEVECDRCLDLLTLKVVCEGELPVCVDGEKAGEYDGEAIWIAADEKEADISQYVYESICLSLPMIRVHGTDADGKSLCDPDMLSRFRIISREEFEQMEQPHGSTPMKEQLEKLKRRKGQAGVEK